MIHATTGKDTVLIAAKTQTSSATTTANLDCRGADWATIRISFGAELNTNAVNPTISLLESDDTVVTNFATVVADQSAFDLTAAKELRYEVDLKARKRYLRLSVSTGTATNDNITFAAIATLSRNASDPASTTDMGDDTVVIV